MCNLQLTQNSIEKIYEITNQSNENYHLSNILIDILELNENLSRQEHIALARAIKTRLGLLCKELKELNIELKI